jgi:hypothetical protein
MFTFIRHIFNIIYWTTPTKKTGFSLFGGINPKGGILSLFNIYSQSKDNAIGFIFSGIAISKVGVAGGGFFNIFSYSEKGEAGAILFSLISIAPKGSTYGTITLFAKDKNNSSEHYFCAHHEAPRGLSRRDKSRKQQAAH